MVEAGRGSLPFALIHGESLVACAAWALAEADVTAVDLGTSWAEITEAGEPFVAHDPLCPMTPPAFIAMCVGRAVAEDRVVVGVRPVTDTVKNLDDGVVGRTEDRTRLLQVASPVVLPARVVAELDGLPHLEFAALVTALAERYDIATLDSPPEARRVIDQGGLTLLEALTRP